MLSPQEVTDLVSQIIANAGKLGLTWQIRPATVVGSDDDGNALVVIDGPDLAAVAPTPATPLDGLPLTGARVFVVTVPPNGDYVVGSVPSESHARMSGERGEESISFGPATSFIQVVTFERIFSTLPTVLINIRSGAGATANWHCRAISISVSQFTLFGFGPSSTWVSQPVQWAAFVNE